MRILIHLTADHVADELHQIAWEIDQGRTFGAGWCLTDGQTCPVPPDHRQMLPCHGNISLCKRVQPTSR